MAKAVIPKRLERFVTDWQMSPGVDHGGFVFLSGMLGTSGDAGAPAAAEQIEIAFARVNQVLDAAGLGFEHVVEMTSYHVGLREHLEDMKRVRAGYVREPYPAWTAIEVAGFVREGAVIELRCIARRS